MARMRRVNVDGVIHTIRAVAPRTQERGYGRIVALHWLTLLDVERLQQIAHSSRFSSRWRS
jgi:hypothetical protein